MSHFTHPLNKDINSTLIIGLLVTNPTNMCKVLRKVLGLVKSVRNVSCCNYNPIMVRSHEPSLSHSREYHSGGQYSSKFHFIYMSPKVQMQENPLLTRKRALIWLQVNSQSLKMSYIFCALPGSPSPNLADILTQAEGQVACLIHFVQISCTALSHNMEIAKPITNSVILQSSQCQFIQHKHLIVS